MAQPVVRSAPTEETALRTTLIENSRGAVSGVNHPLNTHHGPDRMVTDALRLGRVISILEGDRPNPPTPNPRESAEQTTARESLEQRRYVWDAAVRAFGSAREALENFQNMRAELFVRLAAEHLDDVFGMDETRRHQLYEHLIAINERARAQDQPYRDLYAHGTDARHAILSLLEEVEETTMARVEAPPDQAPISEVVSRGAVLRQRRPHIPFQEVRTLVVDAEQRTWIQTPDAIDATMISAFIDRDAEDMDAERARALSQAQNLAQLFASAASFVDAHGGSVNSQSRQIGEAIADLMDQIHHSSRGTDAFREAHDAFEAGNLQQGLELLDGLQGFNTIRDYASTLWTLEVGRNYIITGQAGVRFAYEWPGNAAVFERMLANRFGPEDQRMDLSPELLEAFIQVSTIWGEAAGLLRRAADGSVIRVPVSTFGVEVEAGATMGWASRGQPYRMTFRLSAGYRSFDATATIPDSLGQVIGGEFQGGYMGIIGVDLDVPDMLPNGLSLTAGAGVDLEGVESGGHPAPYGYITLSAPVHEGDNLEVRVWGSTGIQYMLEQVRLGLSTGVDLTGTVARNHELSGGVRMEYHWNSESGRHEFRPVGRFSYAVMLESVLATLQFSVEVGSHFETGATIDSLNAPFMQMPVQLMGNVGFTFGGAGEYERRQERLRQEAEEDQVDARRMLEDVRRDLLLQARPRRRAADQETEEEEEAEE